MGSSRKAWEVENLIQLVDPQRDALYGLPSTADTQTIKDQPWRKDPHHFKHVRISAVALLKMVMHARSGGSIEIMGLMQGKISGDAFIITDAFRLPVEGTETRVNAGAEADEYQVQYLQLCRENNVPENAIGWYHSHPGYGCWLSGIDVATQQQQQNFLDPYLAIVIDPDRTISAGKVEIGAFRTFPKDYKPPAGGEDDDYQSIPLAKIEDFGAYASQYYSLEVSHYKSTLDTQLLDLLWNKYWASTLSQSPLFSNQDYGTRRILDVSQKIQNMEKSLPSSGKAYRLSSGKDQNKQMEKLVKDGNKIAGEEMTGLMAAEIKGRLFSDIGTTES